MTAVVDGEAPAAAVVRALLALGVIAVDDAVERGLSVTETSVSHRSFRVRVGETDDLFVKQADPVRSQGRDLATEAAVYRLAQSSAALAEVVPACRAVGGYDSLIVLEAVPGTPLSETSFALGRPEPGGLDAGVLCRYGRAVARAHQVRTPPIGQLPWLLTALEPGWGSYGWLPDPCRELLVRLAAAAAMRQGFRAATSAWRPVGLVHGDLRWANVLVAHDAVPPRVWLVDWELACLGDPAWDIASVLADLLAPGAAGTLEGGQVPDLWAAAHAFLGGYRVVAAPAAEEWSGLLHRSVALTGVRLVQTLLEYGHYDAVSLAAMEPILLPWAANLLAAPQAIVSELARAAPCGCSSGP